MFIPNIKPQLNLECTEVNFLDETGTYNGTTNLNGWRVPNACNPGDLPFDTSNITGITIDIYNAPTAGTLLETFTINIIDLPSAYGGSNFIYNATPFSWSHGSGLYSYEYTVTTNLGCNYNSPRKTLSLYKEPWDTPYNNTSIEGMLNICLNKNCNTLEIKEETTVYNSTVGYLQTGWRFDPSVQNHSRKVYIEIVDLSGNILDVIYLLNKDVTPVINLFPSPFNDKFNLPDYTWNYPDGHYKFKYKIEHTLPNQPNFIYTLGEFEKFYTCKATNCVNNLWQEVFNTCEDSKEYESKLETALDADLLLRGIYAKVGCLDISKAQELQDTLLEICKMKNCKDPDCGCN